MISAPALTPAAQPPSQRHAYGRGDLQFGDLRLPLGSTSCPVAILIHGGFWRNPYGLDLMTPLAVDLQRRGVATWNIEYRRVGDPGGGWPGTLVDVAAAADHLRALAVNYPLDLRRVVPIGHSAGGHLAFWLAARHRITAAFLPPDLPGALIEAPLALAGTISLAGVVDLQAAWQGKLGRDAVADLLGGSPTTVPTRYRVADPASLLPLGVPQCIVHGANDDPVPLALSEGYVARATQAGDTVRFHALPGVDHFAPIDPLSHAWALTLTELAALHGGHAASS